METKDADVANQLYFGGRLAGYGCFAIADTLGRRVDRRGLRCPRRKRGSGMNIVWCGNALTAVGSEITQLLRLAAGIH